MKMDTTGLSKSGTESTQTVYKQSVVDSMPSMQWKDGTQYLSLKDLRGLEEQNKLNKHIVCPITQVLEYVKSHQYHQQKK